MILKIAVLLCGTILHVGAQSYSRGCTAEHDSCSSCSRVRYETWYQEEAVLNVLDGTFTVELVQISSRPRSINADGKCVVELNRGFARIPSLKRLSLEDNRIGRIDGFVFEELSALITLNLARNRIGDLEKDSFQGLGKLEILNLNHNSLRYLNDSITDDVLPALRQLYLQHNQLTGINYYAENNLCHSSLEHFYLAGNSISQFNEGLPPCLNNLTHLYLEDNKIREFSIGNMPLEDLSLDGNNLYNIPKITPRLMFLSLSRNNIQNIYNIENAKNLIGLILSYNGITEFYQGDRTFENLSHLEHLALDHNSLSSSSMPLKVFYNLTSLRSLDLTGNEISSPIAPKQFANLPNLIKLLLGYNQLSSFPGRESFDQSQLSWLDLSNNWIQNVSDLQANMIPKLKVLKLGGNPLEYIEPKSLSSDTIILL